VPAAFPTALCAGFRAWSRAGKSKGDCKAAKNKVYQQGAASNRVASPTRDVSDSQFYMDHRHGLVIRDQPQGQGQGEGYRGKGLKKAGGNLCVFVCVLMRF
jgi:hypothetical protein